MTHLAKSMIVIGLFATFAAVGTALGAGPASQQATAPASQPASQPALPKPTQLVNEMFRAYLQAQQALLKDDLAAAKKPMPTIFQSGNALYNHRPALAALLSDIGAQAARANDAKDLAGFREAFGKLSTAMIEMAKRLPPTAAATPSLYAAYCPMVKKDWLQAGKQIHNPYDLGMPECGVLKSDNLVREAPKE